MPKPLKVPSLARSVPKPLKEPSLARSVLKPFKMEQEGEGEGAKRHYSLCHETLLLFAADLLLRWLFIIQTLVSELIAPAQPARVKV